LRCRARACRQSQVDVGRGASQPFQTDLCAMWGACECTTEMADCGRRSSQFDSSVRVEGRAVSRGDVCETLRCRGGGWGSFHRASWPRSWPTPRSASARSRMRSERGCRQRACVSSPLSDLTPRAVDCDVASPRALAAVCRSSCRRSGSGPDHRTVPPVPCTVLSIYFSSAFPPRGGLFRQPISTIYITGRLRPAVDRITSYKTLIGTLARPNVSIPPHASSRATKAERPSVTARAQSAHRRHCATSHATSTASAGPSHSATLLSTRRPRCTFSPLACLHQGTNCVLSSVPDRSSP